jgi:acetyl-CoA carboxylase biotin carboxyl carrier protein
MPSPKDPAEPFDGRLLRELAAILNETGLSEIEVARGDLKIRVARTLSPAPVYASLPQGAAPQPAAGVAAAPGAEPAAAGEVVKSPMVGTVYLQAQPGADPFVRVGDRIEEGQTLLLVEAMKTMNPIIAPRAGRVLEFLVADAQPVEFGEPLVVIE